MELRRIELRSSRMQSEHSTTELQPLAKKSRASTLVQSSRNCSDNIQNDIEKQNKIACYEGRPAEQIPCRRAALSSSCRKPYIEPHEMLPNLRNLLISAHSSWIGLVKVIKYSKSIISSS